MCRGGRPRSHKGWGEVGGMYECYPVLLPLRSQLPLSPLPLCGQTLLLLPPTSPPPHTHSFIGNSVSTFAALAMLERRRAGRWAQGSGWPGSG